MFSVSAEARESVEQLAGVWEAIVKDRGSGEVRDLPGVAVRWSDTRFAFFNTITLTDVAPPRPILRNQLKQAADIMAGKSKPGFLWIFEELLDPESRLELESMANKAELDCAFYGCSMAGEVAPTRDPHHPELEFVRVRDNDRVRDLFDLNALAYDMPIEDVRDGMHNSHIWHEKAISYIATRNGVPVSTATVVEHRGCLFLALVATAPDQQRRGFAEAACRKALYEGWKVTGLRRSVLHATQAGAPVYERIGYKRCGTVGFWALRP